MSLPLIIEPEQLQAHLSDENLLIIDLCNDQNWQQGHLPGAIHVSPRELISGEAPTPGLLPDIDRLNNLFTRIGLTPESHIVVYDDEGGGWAGRFIWTLDIIGHTNYSYLNGGLWAWHNDGGELTQTIISPEVKPQAVKLFFQAMMEKEDIVKRLEDPDFLVWDARGPEEYRGEKITANKSGHIPGAINCEWTELMDVDNNYRIRKDALSYLKDKGIDASKTIVTHCHTHHRSGFTYLVGKSLGFTIKAYPGSWSEWGNDPGMPVQTS